MQTHIVFVFYVRPLKLTIILTDNEGKKVRKQLTTNDVWFLSVGERILVNWNNENQPVDDSGALLNRFLGHVARNVNTTKKSVYCGGYFRINWRL